MRIRKHFRTSSATINYIISDFSLNRISDKNTYFKFCVNNKLNNLNERYDSKLDKLLSFVIMNCDYDNLPLKSISCMIASLSKVTTALTKGILSLIGR